MSQSLKKRYVAKLFANLIGLGIGLVIAVIIPSELGPKAYGDFSFAHQLISMGFLMSVALIARMLIDMVPFLNINILGNVLSSGLVYSVIVIISVFFFPIIFGLRRDDIKIGLNEVRQYLIRK